MTKKKAAKPTWTRSRPCKMLTLSQDTHERLPEFKRRTGLPESRIVDEAMRRMAEQEGVR
jgi:hypothetical protein